MQARRLQVVLGVLLSASSAGASARAQARAPTEFECTLEADALGCLARTAEARRREAPSPVATLRAFELLRAGGRSVEAEDLLDRTLAARPRGAEEQRAAWNMLRRSLEGRVEEGQDEQVARAQELEHELVRRARGFGWTVAADVAVELAELRGLLLAKSGRLPRALGVLLHGAEQWRALRGHDAGPDAQSPWDYEGSVVVAALSGRELRQGSRGVGAGLVSPFGGIVAQEQRWGVRGYVLAPAEGGDPVQRGDAAAGRCYLAAARFEAAALLSTLRLQPPPAALTIESYTRWATERLEPYVLGRRFVLEQVLTPLAMHAMNLGDPASSVEGAAVLARAFWDFARFLDALPVPPCPWQAARWHCR